MLLYYITMIVVLYLFDYNIAEQVTTVGPLTNNEKIVCVPPVENALSNIYSNESDAENENSVMLHSVNWTGIILPGPSSIGQIGILMLMSNEIDKSLKDGLDSFEFKHLKFPHSFRSSLVQVNNELLWAFFEAHKRMDAILRVRLNLVRMPEVLKLLGHLLTLSSTPERDRAVRRYLWQMKEIAKAQCEQANATIVLFKQVTLLVEELRLACIMQRKLGGSEFDLTKAIMRLSILRSNLLEMIGFYTSFAVLNAEQWRPKLLELVKAVEDEIELQDMNAGGRMTRAIVYREAFQAMMLDNRISHVAEIYVTISEGYFLYSLAEVNGFMVIDMNTKRLEATTPYIRDSVKYIRQIIADENDRFNEGITDMLLKVDQAFKGLCENDKRRKTIILI